MPRLFNGERTVFSTNDAGKTGFHMQRMKLDPHLTPSTKYSKCVKDLNVRAKTIKTLSFLEENTEGKIHDTGFSNDYLDMTPKAETTIGKK